MSLEAVLSELAELRAEVAKLREDRVTHRVVEVLEVDAVSGSVTGLLPDVGDEVAGIAWPLQFLPEVGDSVRVRVAGVTPIADPASIAENAITERELDPTVISMIESSGVSYYTAPEPPAHSGPADSGIWIDSDAGFVISRWDGDSWEPMPFGPQAFQAGAVTATVLAATAVDGKTITGAVVRTSAANPRVVMDSANGVRGINGAGVVKTHLGTDGSFSAEDATISGDLRSSFVGHRTRLYTDIATDPSNPMSGLEMWSGFAGETPAFLRLMTSFGAGDPDLGDPIVGSYTRLQGAAPDGGVPPYVDLNTEPGALGGPERNIWVSADRFLLGDVKYPDVQRVLRHHYHSLTLTNSAPAEARLAGGHNIASVTMLAGRVYEVYYTGVFNAGTAGTRLQAVIRAALANVTPTPSSPAVSSAVSYHAVAGGAGQHTHTTEGQPFVVSADNEYAFHLFLSHNGASGSAALVAPVGGHGLRAVDLGPVEWFTGSTVRTLM